MPSHLNSREVADYLLAYTDREAGETISNLKLQKLVYYAQGLCVAMRGEPLFGETIQAWDNGPVVRLLYDDYKHHGWRSIDPPEDFDPGRYLPEDRELLDAILATYGQLSAVRLRDLTHAEPPWRDAYRAGNRNEPITIEALRIFFSAVVDAAKKAETLQGGPLWPIGSLQHQDRRKVSDRMESHRARLRAVIAARRGGSCPWLGDDED